MSVRISVESLSGCAWNGCPSQRGIRTLLMLDSKHRVIAFHELFRGTLDGASVYPREVVKIALEHNAAAMILVHNHPSGDPEPSQADRALTIKLKEALSLVGVRTLDHVIVGQEGCVSLAEQGCL